MSRTSQRTQTRRRGWADLGRIPWLVVVLIAAGCAVNPATGKKEFSLVSADQEAQIGREGYPAVLAEYGQTDDARLQAYVDSLGHRLAAVSELPNLDWHFTLLDDPTVNAFAMPGGYIYVTRGILAHLNSEAQLAGVMGHEIGHVTARHGARQMTQQQLAGLGLGLAGAFSTTFRQYSGAAQQGLALMMLKYSRDDENQADQLGVTYATRAGYDPRVIPDTYAMLARISAQSGSSLPGFLSTHPDPGDRQVRTTALAASAAAGKTGLLVREREYLRRLDGLLYGNDPRQGYVEGDLLIEPKLGFQMSLPAGWKRQATRQSLVTANAAQTAGMEVAVSSKAGEQTPEGYVAALQSAGTITSANGRAETLGGYPAWVGFIIVPAEAGPQRMVLGFVRATPTVMLQITGRSAAAGDADEQAMMAALRSVRPIADPAKREPSLQRVTVAPAPKAGSFESVVQALGTQAIGLEETAILNNRESDQDVLAGDLLKVVKRVPH